MRYATGTSSSYSTIAKRLVTRHPEIIAITAIALILAGGAVMGEEVGPKNDSAAWWLRRAAEEAAGIEPAKDMAGRYPRDVLFSNIFHEQVLAGDAEGAIVSARAHAPHLLGDVARAQAWAGHGKEALATIALIADAKLKQDAYYGVVDGLLASIQLAEARGARADGVPDESPALSEARRVLQARLSDEGTGPLWLRMAQEQAKASDLDAVRESIARIGEAPDDGYRSVRQTDGYIALAAAQARTGDLKGFHQSIAQARGMSSRLRQPYQQNTMNAIALAEVEAGEDQAAAATLATTPHAESPVAPDNLPDLILAAKVRHGAVAPADAVKDAMKRPGGSPVYDAAMKAQLAAGDYRGTVQTLRAARYQSFAYSDVPQRIIDGFLSEKDVKAAAAFAEGLSEPASRARVHGYLAGRLAASGDRAGYRSAIGSALAAAGEIIDPPPGSALAGPRRNGVLEELLDAQASAGDFDGAGATLAKIDAPGLTRRLAIRLRARELAGGARFDEAQAWVKSLTDSTDRVEACRGVAQQVSLARGGERR